MADINTTLGLDLDEAFRDLDRFNDAINRALGTVEVRLDALGAQRQLDQLAQDADRALSDVDVDIDSTGAARLNDELAQAERNLTEADREADQLTRSLRQSERAAADVDRQFSDIRQNATNLLGTIGAAAAIAGAVRLASQAREAFATLQDSVNAVKVVFGEASGTVLEFSDTVAQTAGLSMAAFNQAASVLGSSLINVGFGFEEAAKQTIDLTQRAADMASIFGGEVSVAVDAIMSALRGESNPIERFGVTLTEAKVQAEAAALGFQRVGGEFDSTAKAAARLEIIMRETERTAGDFANTSGDLANASKVAAAEFENAKASLGEALLPVFQALLDIGPEVLETIEDLGPSLSSLAVGAGNLATSTPGILDFVDALRLLTDLPRGFGQLFDGINLGLSTIIPGFNKADEALQNMLERRDTQGLIDDLREGGDAATVLANRLADVGKKGKLDPRFIADLAKVAGVDLQQNVVVLVELINNAERLGLAADDVTALRIALGLLSDQGAPTGPIRSLSDRIREIPEAIPEAVGSFDDLRFAAEEAGLGMNDLVLGLDPVARALADALTPAERTALTLTTIGEDAGVAAEILANNLRPAIVDVSGALEDLNEDGRVTKTEFITNLREMTAAAIETGIGLASIATFSPETAAALAALPIEQAIDLVKQFRGDEEAIQAAAEAITGTPEQLGQAILEVYGEALTVLQSGDRKAIDTFLAQLSTDIEKNIPGVSASFTALFQPALAASFADLESPDLTPVFTSSVEGMDAGQITASLDAALAASFADVEAPDLTPQMLRGINGWDSEAIADSVEEAMFANVDLSDFALAAAQALTAENVLDAFRLAGEAGAQTYIRAFTGSGGLQEFSPSHVFMDIGERTANAFSLGWDQADLTLRQPEVGVTGTATSGVSGTAGGGGIHVELTTINPTQQDEVSDVARMGQIASSIAASYRSVVPNGM